MKRSTLNIIGMLVFISSFSWTSFGSDWPNWRGPFFNGSTDEQDLPDFWSPQSNIVWSVELPGRSGTTPIIINDTVFTISPDAQKNVLLFSINAKSGKINWKQILSTGDFTVGKNNTASSSPATDGNIVVAMTALGDVKCFDMSGKLLWSRNIANDYGKFAHMWLYGSSPILISNRLYILVLQNNKPVYSHSKDDKPERESFILCLDSQTGKTLWRQIRKTDAIDESQESYSTPCPVNTSSGMALIVFGADCITAHNLDSGSELWRFSDLNPRKVTIYRTVPSPVTFENFVYVSMPKRQPLYAIEMGSTNKAPKLAWKFEHYTPDVCTPLVYKKKLFVLDGDRQLMTCLDPLTGNLIWQGNLGIRTTFSASPTGADNKIYCISEQCNIVVLDARDSFKIISSFKMGNGPCYSSIAVANGHLFIRTGDSIYCVGKKPQS